MKLVFFKSLTKLVKQNNNQIITIINNTLLFAILCIIIFQGYITFLKNEDKFEDPIEFVKQNYGNDYITQYGNRFEDVTKMFPKPIHLCYVGESNSDFALGIYALTQYYLSPNILIKNNINCDTILYNLYSSIHIDPNTNYHLQNGWHIIKDFKNGLIILAK